MFLLSGWFGLILFWILFNVVISNVEKVRYGL